MREFVHGTQASRVVFGVGSLRRVAREVDALGVKRALVLATPGQTRLAQRVVDLLGASSVGQYCGAAMHVPIQAAREAGAEASRLAADGLIAIGGGSSTGLAKAVALVTGLPILAIPTTYAGSEMTPIFGVTEAGLKKTGRDARVLPRCVIYDPELTLGLPLAVSINSGLNGIAHAAEGLYAQNGNPLTDLMAEEGIAALARAIPAIRARPDDVDARSDALYGAWLCGAVLGQVGMALHHKLCHTLGGSFNLPHAQTHAVILPHALAFNAAAAPQAMLRIARALGRLGQCSAQQAMFELAQENGATRSLREIGMKAGDLDQAADMVVDNPYWSPRPVGPQARAEIRALLQRAFDGAPPEEPAASDPVDRSSKSTENQA